MSYEDQLKKWGAKKAGVPLSCVTNVDLDVDHEKGYEGGCDTCDYGADNCSLSFILYVYGEKSTMVHTEYLYSTEFTQILKEIIEA